MIAFVVFCLAAFLVFMGGALLGYLPLPRRVHRDGITFVGAVLLATLAGLALNGYSPRIGSKTHGFAETIQGGGLLLGLTGSLFALSALRSAKRWPAWVSDAFTVAAAFVAILLFQELAFKVLRRPATNSYINLRSFAVPLTVAWICVIARMTAALNRVPQVTGGYLGLVALTFVLLLQFDSRTREFFPSAASAALAGAGLATVPLALRRPHFNIGWSASLSMGFLLALTAAVGLLKNAAFAILLLSLIAFGLPLLDVSFYQLRAALRGKRVTWEETRWRLYEVLLRRGLSAGKVALLYLAIGASLCGMGVVVARLVLAEDPHLTWWMRGAALLAIVVVAFVEFVVFFSLTRILMRRTQDELIPENVEAFGVRLSPVSMTEAMDKIESFIQSKTPHHVVTSDANSILRAREDPEYAGILSRAAMITPDGYGVIWGARLLNLPIYERVTGVDMVTGICERASTKGYSIYILGSAPGIAATAAQKLCERYPGLKIAGTQHGYFEKENVSEEEIVRRIRAAKPDVLFVAFGIPKQEKFIAQHFEALDVPVCLGVGGSFDVYSEKLKRAPEYIQRSGMEWLYRVWQEPWRWKRMSYVPRFMAFAIREWLFGAKAARR